MRGGVWECGSGGVARWRLELVEETTGGAVGDELMPGSRFGK